MQKLFTSVASLAFATAFMAAAAAPTPQPTESTLREIATEIKVTDLDPETFCDWVDGKETKVRWRVQDFVKTADGALGVGNINFGVSENTGIRHLRVGFKAPIRIGTVLVRGGGNLSFLKADAPYPGILSDESQWVNAERLDPDKATDFTLWVLPPGTDTRALRFSGTDDKSDQSYKIAVSNIYILPERFANIASFGIPLAGANPELETLMVDGLYNGSNTWDNGPRFDRVVSRTNPVSVILYWKSPVKLRALNALWAGFDSAEVETYIGPKNKHPKEAEENEWAPLGKFSIRNGAPYQVSPNWLDFKREVTTQAIRLKITTPTQETNNHLTNQTKAGKRVWLGELQALSPLEKNETIATTLSNVSATSEETHPPIPIHFSLEKPGTVTFVIDDENGQRVRNLISAQPFPAGKNTVWWDGTSDIKRDPDAASHGINHIPAELVKPGKYKVRGLVRDGIDLRYEFSVYTSGNPAWETQDRRGGWLTNHTPPQSSLFVPAEQSPTKEPIVYLGSYIAEGGAGLAYVNLEGVRQGGQPTVGGSWTGAPFLARNGGENPVKDVYAFALAGFSAGAKLPDGQFQGELRVTAITSQGDKPVINYKFPSLGRNMADQYEVGGIAAHNGIIAVSLSNLGQIVFIDARTNQVLGNLNVENPRGLAFDSKGRLLVLSRKDLLRFEVDLKDPSNSPPAQKLVTDKLEDPMGLAQDGTENIYISDWGKSHQVKVFSPSGKFIREIGKPGIPRSGIYDPDHMNHPYGITIDSSSQLWVAECDYQPKRVSKWSLEGKLIKSFFGPSCYGGGGKLDPDKKHFYFWGIEFALDWEKGESRPTRVLYRPDSEEVQSSTDKQYFRVAMGNIANFPETPIYLNGSRYFSDSYNSHPTNGTATSFVFLDRDGQVRPIAAMGKANHFDLLKREEFRSRWPEGIDIRGDHRAENSAFFSWSDLNGDYAVQPEEVTFIKGNTGGVTVMPDLSYVISFLDEKVVRFTPQSFTDKGVPVYDLGKGETLIDKAMFGGTSGGDMALYHPSGLTVTSNGSKPFERQSLGGGKDGHALWSYPSLWLGLHNSTPAPLPDGPGMLIGTTRIIGYFVEPKNSDVGPIWGVNGNAGTVYLFTADGLFVDRLFKDQRVGQSWNMNTATRDMLLNDVTAHGENFWPQLTQTADGNIYLVDGGRTSIVRIDGLESIRRLPDVKIDLTAADLSKATNYVTVRESQRQNLEGRPNLKVTLLDSPPVVDGKSDEWTEADRANLDRLRDASQMGYRNHNYKDAAAITIAGDKLYGVFETEDSNILQNSGEMPTSLFKTGGALDLMIGAISTNDKRQKAEAGDIRVLITRVKDKLRALVYRAVVPGTKDPIPFSSPLRTITFDKVDDISAEVELAVDSKPRADGRGQATTYEFSIPLSQLGLVPKPGMKIRADIGLLRGDGFQTLQRTYWSNKATGIVSDIPSEAELRPDLWGTWIFEHPSEPLLDE